MSRKLLPCPFCGGKAGYLTMENNGHTNYEVECKNEGCEIGPCTCFYESRQKAAEIWNQRMEGTSV